MSPDVPAQLARWLLDILEQAAESGARRALEAVAAQAREHGRLRSATDVAEQLSVSTPTARQLLHQAGIRPVKLGNVLRYSGAEIAAWLKREQAAQSKPRHEGRIEYLIAPTVVGNGTATTARHTARARSR